MPACFRPVSLAAAAASVAALCLMAPSAMAAAATWTVDKAASRLTFKSAFSGESFDAAFKRWDAQITFDPKALAASKVVVTVDTGSAATGNAERDEALPSADWLSVMRFPRATFVTRSFKDLGGGRYQAIGDLTLRGVSKPLVLHVGAALKHQVWNRDYVLWQMLPIGGLKPKPQPSKDS